jgi:S-adenosylmethionine hydrolase
VPFLPTGVHVAVVDPGVGTHRRGIGLATPGGLLVGPDNGLLLDAATALGGITIAVELTNPQWLAPTVSRTFHGRDVFAPVAARLALGVPLAEAGPALDPATLVRLPTPVLHRTDDGFAAEVLTVDHFGNVQLAAPADLLDVLPDRVRVAGPADRQLQAGASAAAPRPEAVAGAVAVRGLTFGDAPAGELVVYPDSAGLVAVAVNTGRAADRLGVRPGDVLTVTEG